MTIVALFYPLHPASIILNAIIVARDEGRHFFFLAKWKQSPSGADKSREEDVRHVVETKRNGKRGSRSVFDRRRGSWNAPRGRGGGGGDARPKEEFRRKTYAFAIPRRISLEGSGVVDRWIMLAQRDGRGDTRRGRFSRFFSRDRWPKARRVHVLCLACSDILRTDCRISSYKLFPPHSFPVFFSPALPLLLRWNRTPIAPESSLPTKTTGHSFFYQILTKFFSRTWDCSISTEEIGSIFGSITTTANYKQLTKARHSSLWLGWLPRVVAEIGSKSGERHRSRRFPVCSAIFAVASGWFIEHSSSPQIFTVSKPASRPSYRWAEGSTTPTDDGTTV